jgi:hypothetical protein
LLEFEAIAGIERGREVVKLKAFSCLFDDIELQVLQYNACHKCKLHFGKLNKGQFCAYS